MVVARNVLDDIDIPVLRLQQKQLGNVHKYNYLGVIVDAKLSFDEFVEAKYNKVNARVLQLYRKYITEDTALTIYTQMIVPLFEFMAESASKAKVNKLEKASGKSTEMHRKYETRAC